MQAIIFMVVVIVFMGIVRSMRDRAAGSGTARTSQTPPTRTPGAPVYEDWDDGYEEEAAARDPRARPELQQLARELLSRAKALEAYDDGSAHGPVGGNYPLESYAVPPPEGVDLHPAHQRYRAAPEPVGTAAEPEAQEDADPYGVFSLGEDALARAMVLREVLGPPVSRRRAR